MASFKNDYEMGTKNEDKVLIHINSYFNDNIVKSTSKISKYDYKGDEYYYELKTRNNNYKTYPTTLIPYNKIMTNKKQIFLFDFKDGLYYIEYTPDVFNEFELKHFVRNQRIDYNDIMSMYYYIPIEKLKKIV
jgi:hypothetical protein